MISLAEARALISQHSAPLPARVCTLPEALGRVLRVDVQAREDFPAFDRSSMDGYAIALGDRADRFAVVGEVQAGDAPKRAIGAGECMRIFTGACIPEGASQVIMQEQVRREGSEMVPLERDARTHIRRQGEEARVGDLLLRAGTRLGAGELSLLAFAGCTKVEVTGSPRVLHIATGGELVSPEAQPAPGQIRDSNSTLVAALLQSAGAGLLPQRRCGDDPATLRTLVSEVPVDSWDLLLISGGASVGDYDFGTHVLRDLGFEIVFTKLHLKPGKPLVFAHRSGQLAFVIPGNPVSHYVTFQVAIRAALQIMEGASPSWPLIPATLTAPLPAQRDPRETFWPARIQMTGELTVRPLKQQSSGDLGALTGANALIRLLPPTEVLPAGSMVSCLLLSLE